MTDRRDTDDEQIAMKELQQPSYVPLTAEVVDAVQRALTDLSVRARIRGYRAKRRTKLSQLDVFRVVLQCAHDSCSAQRLWVAFPSTAHIKIHERALLDRLAAEQLILPMAGDWPAFKKKNMANVGPHARRIVRRLRRSAPDVTLDTSEDPWTLTLVLPAAPSLAGSFDPQKYVGSVQREMEELVHSESFGTLTLEHFYPIQIGSRPSPSRIDETEEPMTPSDISCLLVDTENGISVVADRSGAGKSTLLREIARRAAADYLSHQPGAPLPIYLECSPTPFEDLAAALTKHSGTLVDESAAKAIIHRNKCLFLLDSYDNMDTAIHLRPRPITNLLAFSPMSRAIVATRDTNMPALGQSVVYSVLPPSDPVRFLLCHGIEERAAANAVDDIREAGAHALLQTPFYLWSLARLLRSPETENIPHSPGGIVKAVVADILVPDMFKRPRAVELGFSIEFAPHVVGALGLLAHHMVQYRPIGRGVSPEIVERVFADYFAAKRQQNAGGLAHGLIRLVSYHSFLRRTDSGNFRFQHVLFLAFFVVSHVCSTHADRSVTAVVKDVCKIFRRRDTSALLLLEGLLSAEQMNDAVVALARKEPRTAALLSRFAIRKLRPQTEEFLVAKLLGDLARFDRNPEPARMLDFDHLVLSIAQLRSEVAMKALVSFMSSAKREWTIKAMPSAIARSRCLLAAAPLCALIDSLLGEGCLPRTDKAKRNARQSRRDGTGRSRQQRRALLLAMAIQTLGLLRAKESIATLRRVAMLPDKSIAEQALLALGWMRAEDALPVLLELLHSAITEDAKITVVLGLGLIGNREAAIALIDLLEQGASPTMCTAVSSAFLDVKDRSVLPDLERVASHPPSFAVFRAASEILAEIGPKGVAGYPTEKELEIRFQKLRRSERDTNSGRTEGRRGRK
jgi:hypothetical protein